MLSADFPARQNFFRPISPIRKTRPVKMETQKLGADVVSHTVVPDHFEHIFIVTGPAGCGKTTVATYLSENLKCPYVEGDDFHPQANKDKMASGQPLTDADRWDWLIILKNEAIRHLSNSNAVVVTCSALKRKYRDVIRVANYEHPTVQIHFVFLKLNEELLQQRVAARVGHYMKKEMVHSQMVALEEPDPEIETDVLKIDVTNEKEQVQREALERATAKIKEYEEVVRQERHVADS